MIRPQGTYKTWDDTQLIANYIDSQNQLYFGELYERYADKIYSKCYGMLKDEGLAGDAAQEIFMKIFLKLSTFNGQAKFSTWVFSITYNYCIDIIRKNKKFKGTVSTDDEENNLQIAAPEQEMSDAEFLELDLKRLYQAMEDISPEERALLILKYKDNLSIKDLAEMTQKNESTIKMRLKRAKEKVRAQYDNILISTIIFMILWMKK